MSETRPIRQARESAAQAASDAVSEAAGAVADAATSAAAATGATEPVEEEATEQAPFGLPGKPLNRHSPFYIGFVGAVGVLVAYGLLLTVTRLSQVITLLVVSLFLALGLEPIVQLLQARGVRRRWAVLVVVLGVIGLFAALTALVVPPVVTQATQLANNAPDYVQNLLHNRTVRGLDNRYHVVSNLQGELERRLKSGSTWSSIFGGVLGAAGAVLSGFFSALTVLILTLYLLASLPTVKAAAYRMVPRSRRQRVTFLSEEITRRVGGYVIGQIGVASINATCSFIMMEIVGIPYAAVLAVLVGVLGLIPLVGATLGAVLVVLVALFSSLQDALIVAIYYVGYQQFENYVIVPRVMRRTVSVPGAITVVAALAGASLLGIVGALIAIPTAAGLLLIYQEVLLPRQQQQ